MVTMKIDVSNEGIDVNKASGFEPYEGDVPRPGVYAAILQSCRIRISQNGNPYFNVMFLLDNQNTPEKQAFKGYPAWERITPGESEMQKERVAKFMHTVCGKLAGNVLHDEVTEGGKVNKIGGKDPVGTRCRITLQRDTDQSGNATTKVSDIFPWPKGEPWPAASSEVEADEEEIEEEEEEVVEDAEEEEEEEVQEEEVDEFEERQAELAEMDRNGLKVVLKGLDAEFKVLKRHSDEDLANAILDIEFPPESTEEEEEDETEDEPPF